MKGKATLLLLLLLLLLPLSPASAQEPRRAILLEGPTEVRGVALLEPNAFRAQRAVYELSGEVEAEVYLLQLLLEEPLEWDSFSCPPVAGEGVDLASRETGGRRVYAYRSEEPARTILIALPGEEGCAFLDAFLEELAFFSSALSGSRLLPFPAVFNY
ncbi:MAG: hypothetical protein ACOC45_06385 [Alkalispirochaetaceae bacterium]